MAAGGRINDSYNRYKSKGNVFITITNDSYSKLYNAYSSASEPPEFPIIGSDGGSSQLTSILNASSTVGTSYLIYPDGTYEGAYKGGSDYGVGFYLDKADPPIVTSYTLTVTKGSGSGDYKANEVVSVTADAPQSGFKFEKWIGDTQYVANTGAKATSVTMPGKDISIEATYIDTTTKVFNLTVKKGSGSGNYQEDEEVSVVANNPETGFKFDKWIGDTQYVANTGAISTKVTMPGKNISIEATYVDTTTITFTLSVINGSGSGNYSENTEVSVEANTPDDGYVFDTWIGDTEYLSSISNAAATITMPGKNISIEATFRDTSGGDIDTTNPIAIMQIADWTDGVDTVGSTIEIDSSKLKSDNTIIAKMQKAKSDADKNEWAWVKLSAYLGNDLAGVTAIKVIYKASDSVNLVLDQENLNEAGTSYLSKLNATDGAFKTVLLTKSDFAQPAWHKGDEKLELDKVKSLSFEAIKESSSVDISVKEFILYNYVGDAIISKIVTKEQGIALSTLQGNIALQVPTTADYKIAVYGVDGRVLYSQLMHLSGGLHTLSQLNTSAKAIRLITIEGAGKSACFRSLVQ